ncbi:MAG: putative metalloprotease CJM1_0395 family protein [Desulforhopalus sp.]|nr:putative metalloprotease CJM1_0395 family protein [Desulforhopalus sp.]
MENSIATQIGSSSIYPKILTANQAQAEVRPGNAKEESPRQNDRDSVTLSLEGLVLSRDQSSADLRSPSISGSNDDAQLDHQEILQLQELKQRDTEVRTHEQAHLAAAGQYARGGATFTYQKGPDGASYAVGGEVGIDMGKESSPEATIQKMQTIKRAALAPASPSAADRSIASHATITESQARQEILLQRQEDLLQSEVVTVNSAAELKPTPESIKSQDAPATAPSYGALRTMIAAYQNNINITVPSA